MQPYSCVAHQGTGAPKLAPDEEVVATAKKLLGDSGGIQGFYFHPDCWDRLMLVIASPETRRHAGADYFATGRGLLRSFRPAAT